MQRIVSFLPSATEILFALGLEDEIVGVTFECDYPQGARAKPKVVHTRLPSGLTPAQIDALVRSEGAEQRSLYFADLPLLESLRPELILLQDLCRVCAMDSPQLARNLGELASQPQMMSLSGHSLEGVLADTLKVGEATGRAGEAVRLIEDLRARARRTAERALVTPQSRVLALEWLDPFYQGGHWIPEMIEIAGGMPILAVAGAESVRLELQAVVEAEPDLIVVMPCGFDLPATVRQYRECRWPAEWLQLRAVREGRVYAVDGSAYFSRPGPRLWDGIEILAQIFRGEPGAYERLTV